MLLIDAGIFTALVYLNCFEAYYINKTDALRFRERVRDMFKFAYTNYMQYAFPQDELCPLSCSGQDTLGGYALTLIDSLDSLFVFGMCDEFQKAYSLALDVNFEKDTNVSVFETNIRVVGGLLAGHMVAPYCGIKVPEQWPCAGPMLDKAAFVADKLLKAFKTETQMPVGTVNLASGIPKGETRITCTAGVGTFIMEFGALSALTGQPKYERAARKALDRLWQQRTNIDLVGCHINVSSAVWTDSSFTIGSSVDSYLEYLLKGSILLDDTQLLNRFDAHMDAVKKYARFNDFHIYVSSLTGTPSLGLFQSLDAFFPGMLALSRADLKSALELLFANHGLWRKFGCLPEHFDLFSQQVLNSGPGYPLRPEHVESIMYLYRILKAKGSNQTLLIANDVLKMAVDVLSSFEFNFRTSCGFAGTKDVRTDVLVNRMESFFLSETLKYLFLTFDSENVIFKANRPFSSVCTGFLTNKATNFSLPKYIFTTEGHVIDKSLTDFCRRFHGM